MGYSSIQTLFSLEGKKALVTGCAAGIGNAICTILSSAGADIIGGYNSTSYRETERVVREHNNRVFHPVEIDLSKPDTINFDGLMEKITDKAGNVDILINNAGINIRNMALDYQADDWNTVFNVNLKSMFLLSQAFAKQTIKSKRKGKIIQIASLLGFQGGYRTAGYTASKHGVIGLTKLLANEWGEHGIQVNAIAPGYIVTAMTDDFIKNEEISNNFLKRIPLGRWGKPKDLQGTVLLLASAASDYIHGTTIVVDGGYLNS